MSITLEAKYQLIKDDIIQESGANPVEIAKKIMKKGYINMHGPEHHFLDGASFLVAYHNAGGIINIEEALEELQIRTFKMPGAMCGLWGVCGSTTAVGASLSIIHGTTPLSTDDFYKEHMEYTSSVIDVMSKIGGPRCCKRNAFISLSKAVVYVNIKYNLKMDISPIKCEFHYLNKQCINKRCPFIS